MTLRQALGGDAARLHDLVDRLLDEDDGVIVLVDGQRAISYAAGFGLSPCQLELVTIEAERAVRTVAGYARTTTAEHAIDEALAASFPASDPPPWNPGSAHPGLDRSGERAAGPIEAPAGIP